MVVRFVGREEEMREEGGGGSRKKCELMIFFSPPLSIRAQTGSDEIFCLPPFVFVALLVRKASWR